MGGTDGKLHLVVGHHKGRWEEEMGNCIWYRGFIRGGGRKRWEIAFDIGHHKWRWEV